MVTGAGKVIIGQEFTASFAAYVTISDTGEEVILSIECPPEPAATFRYPRAFFANEDQIKQWASSVLRLFPDSWPLVVGFEAAQHISDLGFLLAGLLGNVPVNFDDVLKLHVKASADHLKLRFRQPRGRGRHSKWSKPELEAIITAVLARKPSLTWDAIRDEIAAAYPRKAPASGEALRVLAHGFGLSLRQMKKRRIKN